LVHTKRPDGKIAITLDNNVWNSLYDGQIDLAAELSSEKSAIYIPREVEIETLALESSLVLW
jgi:rRNA-processing protein FCF1